MVSNSFIENCFPEIYEDKNDPQQIKSKIGLNPLVVENKEQIKVLIEVAKVVLTMNEFRNLTQINHLFYKKNTLDVKENYEKHLQEKKEEYAKICKVSGAVLGATAGAVLGGEVGYLIGMNHVGPATGCPVQCAGVGFSVGVVVGGIGGGLWGYECGREEGEVWGLEKGKEEKKLEIINSQEYKRWKNEEWKTNILSMERIFSEIYNENKDEIECSINNSVMDRPTKMLDGKMYEYEMIRAWVSVNNSSPITNERISIEDAVEFENNYYLEIAEKFFINPYNEMVEKVISAYKSASDPINKLDRLERFVCKVFERNDKTERDKYLENCFVEFFKIQDERLVQLVNLINFGVNVRKIKLDGKKINEEGSQHKICKQSLQIINSIFTNLLSLKSSIINNVYKKIED